LFIYLAVRRKGKDASFAYSYREILRDSGMVFRTISRGIKQLAKAGFIEYEHGGLMLNHNIYYIDPGWLDVRK